MELTMQRGLKLIVRAGADERHAHGPLHEEVLRVLREFDVNGATLTKGTMSFGGCRRIHTAMNEITMENLPIIVEAVDDAKRIRPAAERIAELLGDRGLVELQPTMIVRRASVDVGERHN